MKDNILDKDSNEIVSATTHLIATLLSITGVILLIIFAVQKASVWHIVSFSIFGTSLILLYFFSSLYHLFSEEHVAKKILQKIDHIMIYILIAGSYTPICLVALRGGWGWSIFGVIWGLAITGIFLKTSRIKLKSWISALLYISMGWLIIIAIYPITNSISSDAFMWLLVGGVFYTVGTIFFGLDKFIPHYKSIRMHDVFHVFVMAGSASHFWLMFKYILYI